MADHVFHRPGPLKQANKSHKTGRHRSKGAIDNALKGKWTLFLIENLFTEMFNHSLGKVSNTIISHKHKQIQRREQRRNQMNQVCLSGAIFQISVISYCLSILAA